MTGLDAVYHKGVTWEHLHLTAEVCGNLAVGIADRFALLCCEQNEKF